MKIWGNRRQWVSWRKKEDSMMETLLTGGINPHPPSFHIKTFSENTNWETAALHMSVAE